MEHSDDDLGFRHSPRKLPDDLPRSLDDRRKVAAFGEETEVYDAWQGMFSSIPILVCSRYRAELSG